MRKALTRAAHVLAAAGMLGLARPALAQTALPDTKPTHGIIVRTSGEGVTFDAESVPNGEARLMEMQVEVALLANPGTFGCVLAARHTSAGIELHGFVTNKFVKEQALEIARKHCTVSVIDKLQVNGILEVRIPSANVDELQQGAEALLTEEFGKAAADFEVKAIAPGRLVLHGNCKSCEELVQISKRLRALNGCCSVEIHLNVKPLLRAGHLVTLVTSDGSLTVAAPGGPETPMPHTRILADSATTLPAPVSAPPAPVLAITQPKPATIDSAIIPTRKDPVPPLASARPEVVPSIPAPKPDPLPAVVKKPDVPTPLPVASVKTEVPAPVVPAPKVEPLPSVKKQDLPAPLPVASVKPVVPAPVIPAPKVEPLPPVVKKPDLPTLPTLKTDVPQTFTMRTEVTPLPPVVQPPPSKLMPPVVAAPVTPSFTPVAASVTTPSAPTVVAATLPPVAAPIGSSTGALSNVPAYSKQPTNPGWQTAQASVEHLPTPATVVKAPPPVGGWPTAHEVYPQTQVAYATTGVVMFDDDALPEPPQVFAKDKAEQLKQKVAAACGPKASSVRVETTADGVLHVHVKSAAPDKNEVLTNSILMLPEMASPNVKLDFEETK